MDRRRVSASEQGGLSVGYWVVTSAKLPEKKRRFRRRRGLLRVALPHFVAATAIAGKIDRERGDGQCLRDALDIIEDGLIVLNAASQVIHTNAAAEALLACGDRVRHVRI